MFCRNLARLVGGATRVRAPWGPARHGRLYVTMPNPATSAGNQIVVRLQLKHKPGTLKKALDHIATTGGNLGHIEVIEGTQKSITRDLCIDTAGDDHALAIVDGLRNLPDITVVHWQDKVFQMHDGGKLTVDSKFRLKNRDQLSMAYTPGVARVCTAIAQNHALAPKYTINGNMVAVVSDGTAVLGLGDIGPLGALPVMEGKCMLFKEFAGVNAFPICLNTTDTEEIISIVKALEPNFSGINLEDIAAPRCFEIERRLIKELDIPVFHDDQHGTAVVLTAGLINAFKLLNKRPEDMKVVVLGVGASGTACTKMMMELGITNIIGLDRHGALYTGRPNMNSEKEDYASYTNPEGVQGNVSDCIKGADIFVGLSGPNLVSEDDVKSMNKGSMVFAMSNPIPEIMPEVALKHCAIMATGRSDYPNQINNVLCFPGIFKGAMEVGAHTINMEMKMAAARAIADVIPSDLLSPEYIIPSVFDEHVVTNVAREVGKAARATNMVGSRA